MNFLICSLALVAGLQLVLASATTSFDWARNEYLLAFGDSYTFVQGSTGKLNFSFIGDLFNYAITPQELQQAEIVNNLTSSGGSNWVEFLSGCFSGRPSSCKNQLWDFAYAGADISEKYLTRHHNDSIQMDEQVRQWDMYARSALHMNPATTLVAFFIGINDISDSSAFTNVSFPAFYNDMIGTYFNSVTPGNLASAHPRPNITMVSEFNSAIESHAQTFQAAHADATAVVFDTYSTLAAVLDDPRPFGITNITQFCPRFDAPDIATNFAAYGCSPIAQYFWYNSGHITFTVHKILAGAISRALNAAS